MITEHAHERITVHEDWKDGMNAFRLSTREELLKLSNQINYILKALEDSELETPLGVGFAQKDFKWNKANSVISTVNLVI